MYRCTTNIKLACHLRDEKPYLYGDIFGDIISWMTLDDDLSTCSLLTLALHGEAS